MLTDTTKKNYYQALLDKNTEYDGVFYVAVKTTGIFCRPSCPARKPKFKHCEFYQTAQEALLASYRPCKRCRPLSHPHQVSATVQLLVEAVELNPTKRWKDKDFDELSIDASTARRQFKKRFGMTFVEYARARRLGLALKQIRHGDSVIEAQLEAGFESGSGFRDAFTKIMGGPPSFARKEYQILKASWLDTPLGPMLAIADEEALHLLEFVDRRGLEREVERLRQRLKAAIIPGTTLPINRIAQELKAYFEGSLQVFKTPIALLGSSFQKNIWEALRLIPYGETRSYREQAIALNRPTAYRAVANANGANQLAIIVPCHRIINSNGDLGGYGGGLARKRWLIEHERKYAV
ncbi:bifunctional transcriptional activator/DNA repair enzyme AdaA [Legionella jamestowniensis]|uniref:methylated-DNA--[protein]-cysteine S-methyltransferase n=1 Tax=Legionella jamestowniensis TaxID=455 RepID=A0A0W0UL30_9GAMM|nr:trifunctional transcriptional activator/DNA repair protein Ada/methylated-DNA--[protein]-cysteine S-methyltransferase [Legionella jamestowniensis]KTD08611.1 Ada protein (O6-methylguanine-DNA methyltransferase) [Legionella jamestowniensis]OCH96942.1 cysteine methyltransferase [Legionella jamestowniensis]SFL53573.1 DNA-O6-methylguanine--protein-cysteine S-methyltransferase /Transcriptional regulator Ada [Legionella jamestowniensis DSM 19215]